MLRATPFNAKGYAFVGALVVLVLVLGWRVVTLVDGNGGAYVPSPGETDVHEPPQLVYRLYRVGSRGTESWANDDRVDHEFYRYPLDGSGTSSLLTKVAQEGFRGLGSPWMSVRGDREIFLAPREREDDGRFIDPDGADIPRLAAYRDKGFDGLVSPHGDLIATSDPSDPRSVMLTSIADGAEKRFPAAPRSGFGRLAPLAWSGDGTELYLKLLFDGEGFMPGLWVLRPDDGTVREIESVRKLGIVQPDVSREQGKAVGVTFRCDDLDQCGIGPSKLYVVDLATGEAEALLSDTALGFNYPLLSPDGRRIAYSYSGEDGDVWLVDVGDPSSNRLFISGAVLAWTPDGTGLVVDRGDALQIVSVADKTITTIARRTGKYQDPDFQGLEFIGIVSGN